MSAQFLVAAVGKKHSFLPSDNVGLNPDDQLDGQLAGGIRSVADAEEIEPYAGEARLVKDTDEAFSKRGNAYGTFI